MKQEMVVVYVFRLGTAERTLCSAFELSSFQYLPCPQKCVCVVSKRFGFWLCSSVLVCGRRN